MNARRVARVSMAATATIAAAVITGFTHERATVAAPWTPEELTTIRSMSLATAGPLPSDPSNRFADDSGAAALGRQLFFDTRLSANGKVACGTCHLPEKQFQDGLPLGKGVGTTGRRTMTVVGTAYSPWFFWDGRADSQWSQALGPLESAVEHGGTRTLYARVLAANYRPQYERVFGPLPSVEQLPSTAGPNGTAAERDAWQRMSDARRDSVTRAFVNIGKAIAAFERGVRFTASRFDRYAESLGASGARTTSTTLTTTEIAGLKLFIGAGRCVNCHNGAMLTDNHFHNVAIPLGTQAANDSGRAVGIKQALASEFNCLGRYSDAERSQCAELEFAITDGPELMQAYRTPSLRGVAERAPYGHTGELRTLAAVLDHYNHAPPARLGHSELEPLHLTATQLRQLEAFLRTLSAAPARSGRSSSGQ